MPQALARRIDLDELQENGIVRSAVFPNALRDVRRQKGFATLRDFDGKTPITYTRLAKIERGEIFPEPEELTEIAKALSVPVGRLLLDAQAPEFDREKWARDHIEAKLQNRGGGTDAMLLGAALRVKRLALNRATTDLKEFGLPAATVSRIENADRPVERWDASIMRGVAKILKTKQGTINAVVQQMFDNGELDEMLATLFSPEAIEERNNKRLKVLLSKLPGPKAAQMLKELSAPVLAKAFQCRDQGDGSFKMKPVDRDIEIPAGGSKSCFAIDMAAPVLGPGIPAGTTIIFDPAVMKLNVGDVAAVRTNDVVRVVIVSEIDDQLVGVSMANPRPLLLTELEEDAEVAKMLAMAP